MKGFLVQDWTTIRLASTVTSIAQSEANWLNLEAYQDVTFWLDVRQITLSAGGTNVVVDYETAPLKDDSLFRPMVTGTPLTSASASATPTIVRVIMAANPTPTVPLAQWIRWKLTVTGAPSSISEITFRLSCAANAVGGR